MNSAGGLSSAISGASRRWPYATGTKFHGDRRHRATVPAGGAAFRLRRAVARRTMSGPGLAAPAADVPRPGPVRVGSLAGLPAGVPLTEPESGRG
jgi:hypothetical protein